MSLEHRGQWRLQSDPLALHISVHPPLKAHWISQAPQEPVCLHSSLPLLVTFLFQEPWSILTLSPTQAHHATLNVNIKETLSPSSEPSETLLCKSTSPCLHPPVPPQGRLTLVSVTILGSQHISMNCEPFLLPIQLCCLKADTVPFSFWSGMWHRGLHRPVT